MSSFNGTLVDEEAEAQLVSLTEIQRYILQGVNPFDLNLVVSVDGDFVLDNFGNILKWD